MKNRLNYQYYVEGEDERKLINTLKTDFQVVVPGKVDVFNVTTKIITNARLIAIKPKTTVILVFDTDVGDDKILRQNIAIFKECKSVIDIVTIPQCFNLEDELVNSCKIKTVTELFGSQGFRKFKSDFIKASNLPLKLKEKEFDVSKLWSRDGMGKFKGIENQSSKIKV